MKLGRILVVLATAAFALAVAPSAQAAEGVRLHCGQTISVDTVLANDLINCPNEGIIIGADNITLDLGGHTVDGDGVPVANCPEPEPCDSGVVNSASIDGVPFNGPGHDGVTIKNGVVKDFPGVGVYDFRVADNVVTHLRVLHNGDGILMARSRNGRLEHNTANDNEFYGIVVSAQSGPPRAHDISIEHNTATANGFGGIFVGYSDRVRIAGNSVSGSPDGDGIALFDASQVVIEHNSVAGNGGGLGLNQSSRIVVTENSSHDNVYVGIYVLGGADNRIDLNAFVRNSDGSEGGIHVLSDDTGHPSQRLVITRNVLSGNAGDGILVDRGQRATLITGNTAYANTDDGIDVDSAATTLTANTANRNSDLGIEAKAGVTDGGANRASGNGDRRQCTNISCA